MGWYRWAGRFHSSPTANPRLGGASSGLPFVSYFYARFCARSKTRHSWLRSARQIRLQVTLCHHLNTRVRMRGDPLSQSEVVFQHTVPCGTMCRLTNKTQEQLRTAVAGNGETYGVAITIHRQTGATAGVTQIAIVHQFFLRWLDAFMARGRTMSLPAGTQW